MAYVISSFRMGIASQFFSWEATSLPCGPWQPYSVERYFGGDEKVTYSRSAGALAGSILGLGRKERLTAGICLRGSLSSWYD